MTRKLSLCLPFLLATALFSCAEKSQEPTPSGKLNGDYDFVSLSVDAVTTSETIYPDQTLKVVADVAYTTKDNTGTFKFDGGKAIGSNLSYRVDTTLKTTLYADGVAEDEIEMPFAATIPAYNSAAPYRIIGEDSVYFDAGFINAPMNSNIPATSAGSGARFYISGNTLTLVARFSASTSTTQMGITTRSFTHGTTISVMKKR